MELSRAFFPTFLQSFRPPASELDSWIEPSRQAVRVEMPCLGPTRLPTAGLWAVGAARAGARRVAFPRPPTGEEDLHDIPTLSPRVCSPDVGHFGWDFQVRGGQTSLLKATVTRVLQAGMGQLVLVLQVCCRQCS